MTKSGMNEDSTTDSAGHVVDYYCFPISPWCYLGHDAFVDIVHRLQPKLRLKPVDVRGRIFPASGGAPSAQRPPQRQAYRFVELKRWAEHRGLPINLKPAHFPTDCHDASRLIIATDLEHGTRAALDVLGALLRCVWVNEQDIAEPDTLRALLRNVDLPASLLDVARAEGGEAWIRYEHYTQEALDAQVFGVPWYLVDGEPYWGQDRLEFIERQLSSMGPQ